MYSANEIKSAILGQINYLLTSLPIQNLEHVESLKYELDGILTQQDIELKNPKLKQIDVIVKELARELNPLEKEDFLEKQIFGLLYYKLIELSNLNDESIKNFNLEEEIRDEIVVKLADEFYTQILLQHPQLQASEIYEWVFERVEIFYFGTLHHNLERVLNTVFLHSCPGYEGLELEKILLTLAQPYLAFYRSTYLDIGVLVNLQSGMRQSCLDHMQEILQLIQSSPNHFQDLLQLDENHFSKLITYLPVLIKINKVLNLPIHVLLQLPPKKLEGMYQNAEFYHNILKSTDVPLNQLLSLSEEKVKKLGMHLQFVLNLLKRGELLSTILELSDEQLQFLSRFQQSLFNLFDKYQFDLKRLPSIDANIYAQLEGYEKVSQLTPIDFDELLSISVEKIKFVVQEFNLFFTLKQIGFRNIRDFIELSTDELLIIKNEYQTIIKLLKSGNSLNLFQPKLMSKQLSVIRQNYFKISRILELSQQGWEWVFHISIPVLNELASQVDMIIGLLKAGLTLSEIMAQSIERRREIYENLPYYEYLMKAKNGLRLNDFLTLSGEVNLDFAKYNYDYYCMLKSGFLIEDLCPLYRLYFYEMLSFCAAVTNLTFLKKMDKFKLKLIMSNANYYLEMIKDDLVSMEVLAELSPEILEDINHNLGQYRMLLNSSNLKLSEFLSIDPALRQKIIKHSSHFKHILRHLKDYIVLSAVSKKEIFEHLDAYSNLLIDGDLNLHLLVSLPDGIRNHLLANSELFMVVMPYFEGDFIDYLLAHQYDCLEFFGEIYRNYPIMRELGFGLYDMLQIPTKICDQICQQEDDFLAVSEQLNITLKQLLKYSPEIIERIRVHISEISFFLIETHFSFEDLMQLEERSSSTIFTSLQHLKLILDQGTTDKETLMALDGEEIQTLLSSSTTYATRMGC